MDFNKYIALSSVMLPQKPCKNDLKGVNNPHEGVKKGADQNSLKPFRTTTKEIPKEARTLNELFGLTEQLARGVVFISIDFEKIENIKDSSQNLDCEVGIATLDTDLLESIDAAELISTYNCTAGCPRYQEKQSRKFMFGKSVIISKSDMVKKIASLIPQNREAVLVGHGILTADLQALVALHFDFPAYSITVLDTHILSAGLNDKPRYALNRLLAELECPYGQLHSGGNDANFTLRTLMLLAAKSCNELSSIAEARLAKIKEAALSPVPGQMTPAQAAEKAKQRMERAKKKLSKEHDHHTQEMIRAKRAARRKYGQLIQGFEDIRFMDAEESGIPLINTLFVDSPLATECLSEDEGRGEDDDICLP